MSQSLSGVRLCFLHFCLFYLFGSFIRFFLLEQNSCFFVTAHACAVTSWGSLSYFVPNLTSLDVVLQLILLCSPLRYPSPSGTSDFHQQSRTMAPAEREWCIRRAATSHTHPPPRQEAQQERDPTPRPQVHQLSGPSTDWARPQRGPTEPGCEAGGGQTAGDTIT